MRRWRVRRIVRGVIEESRSVDVTLEPLDEFAPGGRLIVAAWLGKVRLVDNLRVR